MKYCAQNLVEESKRKYHQSGNKDYGRDVYRVSDLNSSKCWYGFIYTRNDSGYELKENIKPELDGLEVYGRNDCSMVMPSGSDDILVLRRT